MDSIIVLVERKNGSTFTQEITIKKSIQETLKNYQKQLGKGYLICDYWRKEDDYFRF